MEEGEVECFITAIGKVAKAKGMTEIAKKSNMNRQNLYKAFSPTGSPKFETVVKVLQAFDFKLTVEQI